MANIFLISDTHFGHEACYSKFKCADGTPLRPFSSSQEGDEELVKRWNSVVKQGDKVYHLGDITMSKKASGLSIFYRLNGDKVLIKGNHDLAPLSEYCKHFYDIRSSHQLDGMLLTHIPVHPESLSRWRANVHGHTHANKVLDKFGKPDPRYLCVSVEQINYTPISLEEVRKILT